MARKTHSSKTENPEKKETSAAEAQKKTTRARKNPKATATDEESTLTSNPMSDAASPANAALGVSFREVGGAEVARPKEKPGSTRGGNGARLKQPRTKTTQVRVVKFSERIRTAVRPFAPHLPPVSVSPEAPRVVRINGRPVIIKGKKVIPPFLFFGNPSTEDRAATVFEELHKAANAGVHLHSLMVEFPVDEELARDAFDFSTYLLRRALEVDPNAHIIFRLVFAGGPDWQTKYPKAVYRYADGTLAEPSICDDDFWGEAQRLLRAYVKGLRLLPEGDHVFGIHLDRGEWFFADGWGYDTSEAGEARFREWARHRYSNDTVALQAAWFDGRAKFENLKVPDYEPYPLSGEGFLRASRKERRWVDYHLFLSDAMVARIQQLAWEVKSASEGWFLIAASYGYTFEWSHPASGHLSLGKLLRTPEVDIICGPPSYKDRQMGGAASCPAPIDSFALNGKLFISEEDFKTPISKGTELDDFNPVMATPQALEAAHWRGHGCALAHGSGIAWMDLWGNGWLNTPSIWSRAEKVRNWLIAALAAPERDPDVAVLIDERSLAYLSDARAFKLLIQDSREAVLRAGVSAGFYLLTDLAHRLRFPDAKLYIFLNAWDVRPEVREAIKNRLHRDGKTLFWVYSAGLFESGRPALERVREVTGIALRPQPFFSKAGTTILNRKHPLTELLEERALSVVEQLEPSYFAIPEEGCTVLGEYTQTGLPSLVVREVKGEDDSQTWRSVFLGEPVVNDKIIRGLCELAGVQVWNYYGDVVHVRPPFLGIHYSGTGHRTATLPERWHAYSIIDEQKIGADATLLKSQATDGASQVLIVGEEAEVDRMISLDVESLLDLQEVPEAEPDTYLEEQPSLNVPIVGIPEGDENFLIAPEHGIEVDTYENVSEFAGVGKPTEPAEAEDEKRAKRKTKKTSRKLKKERQTEPEIGDTVLRATFRLKE